MPANEAAQQILAELGAPSYMEPLRCSSELGSAAINCTISTDPRWLEFVNRVQAGVGLVTGLQRDRAGTVRDLRLDIRIAIDGHSDGHTVGEFHRGEYQSIHRSLIDQVGLLCAWDDNDLNMDLSCLRALGAAASIKPFLDPLRHDLAAIDPQIYNDNWNPFVVRSFTHVERGPEYRGVLVRARLGFYITSLHADEVSAQLQSASWNINRGDGGMSL